MMTAYDWMVACVREGWIPVALADEQCPGGGLPFFCMRVLDDNGNPTPEGSAGVLHPDQRLRGCAVLGLTVGAHRAWQKQHRSG